MSEQKEYIKKDAAQLYAENIREYLNELYDNGWITITDIDWRVLMSLILAINDTPPAEVKPVVRGEWKCESRAYPDYGLWNKWYCSECGYVRTAGWEHTQEGKKPNACLCENCGAEMKEGEHGES